MHALVGFLASRAGSTFIETRSRAVSSACSDRYPANAGGSVEQNRPEKSSSSPRSSVRPPDPRDRRDSHARGSLAQAGCRCYRRTFYPPGSGGDGPSPRPPPVRCKAWAGLPPLCAGEPFPGAGCHWAEPCARARRGGMEPQPADSPARRPSGRRWSPSRPSICPYLIFARRVVPLTLIRGALPASR